MAAGTHAKYYSVTWHSCVYLHHTHTKQRSKIWMTLRFSCTKSIYSTTSSICSTTSSTQTSISSLFSSFWSLWFFSSPNSFLRIARHAFHSSTSLLRSATSSALTLLSSAASSSSKTRENSRRFFRICFCLSFESNVRGLGRQMNCLNRSWMCFTTSCPRKSQIA